LQKYNGIDRHTGIKAQEKRKGNAEGLRKHEPKQDNPKTIEKVTADSQNNQEQEVRRRK